VHGEDLQAALLVEGLELALPDLQQLARWLQAVAQRRVHEEAVLLPIIEGPVHRQLDQRAGVGVKEIGHPTSWPSATILRMVSG
jgi:hypothetical protein